jgi:exodeoxyribonuclease VII large subunit
VAQRIAVVSAPAAAGYGDFLDQLRRNAYGLKFYVRLYDAMMQGEKTASTILSALERINQEADLFDCVVIIRGGGSTSDLAAFDDYNLAAAIAQFPLPVIVGVGHERDITVLDYVAALRVKTPTAAAEALILRGANALAHLDELRNAVAANVRDIVAQARQQLAYFTSLIPGAARAILDRHLLRLRHLAQSVPQIIGACLATERQRLTHTASTVRQSATQQLLTAKLRLDGLGDKATLLSPRNTLNRGYALVKFGGRFITDASQLKPGDVMTVHFKQGMARAVVQSSQSAKK